MLRLVRSASLLLAFCLVLTASAAAQSTDTAGLEVDVRDASGALVQGVTLTLTQTATHDVRTGTSDHDGRFRFTALPVGSYEMKAQKTGFGEVVQNGINLSVGQAATLRVTLSANANEVVQVNSDVSTVDPDRTTVGQTISQEEIENLPSNGRNFLDFVTTVPGVTETQTTGQNSGFSVNGQRSRSNSIMIDGVENNGQINGNVRQTLSQDAIAQFQVLTEQFPAEFGGAGGGFINVVTRGGSDRYHGSLYYFLRNDWLNSPNKFSTASPGNYSRNDLGLSVGGPLRENRTYFFGALEYIGLNTSRFSTIAQYAAQVNPVLQSGVYINAPTKAIDTDSYIPQSSAQTLTSLRVDHRINDRNTLIGRVIYVQYIQANSTNAGSIYDFSTATGTYTHTQNYFAEWTHIFSPKLLNEAHFMVAPQRLKQQANSTGTGADIAGDVYIGPTADFPVTLNEDHYEADDALSYTAGSHLFKGGVQLNGVRAQSYFPTNFNGYWNFYSVGNFASTSNGALSPIPYRFTQSFGNPNVDLPDMQIGMYIEDSWKALSRLTLNYGIRYDLDLQPGGKNGNASDPMQSVLAKGMNRDYDNISPRFGLALALDGKGKTVLRAGYGIFYDKNLLILARNELQTKETYVKNLQNNATLARSTFLAGPFTPSSSYPTGTGVAPTIQTSYPGLMIPRIHQADLGIDRALTSHLVLSITGVHVSGEHLLKAANINLAAPVILTSQNQQYFGFSPTVSTCNATNSSLGKDTAGPCAQALNRPYFADMVDPTTKAVIHAGRKNSNFTDINTVGPWGHSNYNGLRVALQQQAWHGLTVRASYVWSHAEDDAPDFLNGALADNPFNPRAEKSLSNEDLRHRFTGSLVYRVPFRTSRGHFNVARQVLGNWVFSGTIVESSGTPENITVGSDVNNDGSSTDRPFINGVIVGRNTFRGARRSTANLRGQKELRFFRGQRLALSAEAFNAFGHYNITDYVTTWGTAAAPSASFGTADAASDNRTLQLGARYTF